MKIKIIFVEKIGRNLISESLWAIKIGESYKIDSIPFFISNISLGDVIKAVEEDEEYHFDVLIEESGRSVAQVKILNQTKKNDLIKQIEKLGCTWEELKSANIIAVDIPNKKILKKLTILLDDFEKENLIDYRLACISKKG